MINVEDDFMHYFNATARLRAEVIRLRDALDRIANPLQSLQQDAANAGIPLNGAAAAALANDVGYLRGIARNALTTGERSQ